MGLQKDADNMSQSNDFESQRLVSVRHAADLMDMKDTRVIMRLVREGRLRARKIGRRNYIVVSSLNDFCGSGR